MSPQSECNDKRHLRNTPVTLVFLSRLQLILLLKILPIVWYVWYGSFYESLFFERCSFIDRQMVL